MAITGQSARVYPIVNFDPLGHHLVQVVLDLLLLPLSLPPSIPSSLDPFLPQSLPPSIPSSLNPFLPRSLPPSIPLSPHLVSVHRDIFDQAVDLVSKVKNSMVSERGRRRGRRNRRKDLSLSLSLQPDEDFKNTWKLVTLWIGGNDLCRCCSDMVHMCVYVCMYPQEHHKHHL